jgi:hypothetical protein
MIDPDNGDEKIAHRVAEPRRPERKKCLKARNPGRTQIENEYGWSTAYRSGRIRSDNLTDAGRFLSHAFLAHNAQ